MDKRLSQIVCHAFDDCSCCESCFKLLEMMGPLLERPLIHRDFQYKYPIRLAMYNQELDQVKMVYNRQMVAARSPREPMTNKNMLPIGQSMEKLRAINHG